MKKGLSAATNPGYTRISLATPALYFPAVVYKVGVNFVFLYARSPAEYEQVRLSGVALIPLGCYVVD